MFSFKSVNQKSWIQLASLLLPVWVSSPALACSEDRYLGSMCVTAATYCPPGYVEAIGQIIPVVDYQALFAVIGCTYGGNCRDSFALPDMRGRAAIGIGAGSGLVPVKLGQEVGSQFHQLTEGEMPAHTHDTVVLQTARDVTVSIYAFDELGVSPTPSSQNNALKAIAQNPFVPNEEAKLYGPPSGNPVELVLGEASVVVDAPAVSVKPTGDNLAFSIQDPSLGLRHCIAVSGLFPPRP